MFGMRRAMIRKTTVRARMNVSRKASRARRASSSAVGAAGVAGVCALLMGAILTHRGRAPQTHSPDVKGQLSAVVVEGDRIDHLTHLGRRTGNRLGLFALIVGCHLTAQEHHAIRGLDVELVGWAKRRVLA